MTNPLFHKGYEAPSTLTENPDEPLFTLEGQEGIILHAYPDIIPKKVSLLVSLRHTLCTHPTTITMTPGQRAPLRIYTRYPASESVEFVFENQGTYTIKDDIAFLTPSGPYQPLLPESRVIYRHPFRTLTTSLEIPTEIEDQTLIYPHGGTLSPDPNKCWQTFFSPFYQSGAYALTIHPVHHYSEALLEAVLGAPTPKESLGDMIRTGQITLSLRYKDDTFSYRSIGFHPKSTLFILEFAHYPA